jgi:hypothetical protein
METEDDVEIVDDAAEEPPREIIYNTSAPNAAQWEQAVNQKAYSYRDKQEYIKKPEPPPEIPGWYKILVSFVRFLTSTAGQIILWSGLALVVGYVIYRILAGQGGGLFGRADRRAAAEDPGPISEEGLLESNWEERLHAALAAGDTRQAIRYSYMHVLQVLQERGLIMYRPDKTNTEYYFALTESLRPSFRTISRQYEFAWYGNFIPGADALESYMQSYNSLKKNITYA